MRKSFILIILPIIIAFVSAYYIYDALIGTDIVEQDIKLEIVLDSFQESNFQFFLEDSVDFKPENSKTSSWERNVKDYKLLVTIADIGKPGKLRLDPSITKGTWIIKKITLKGLSNNVEFSGDSILKHFTPNSDVKTFELTNNKNIKLESTGNDAYIVSDFELKDYVVTLTKKPYINILPFCFSLSCFIFICYLLNQKFRPFLETKFNSNHVLVISFITIISLPFLWMNLFPIEQNVFTEKRVLKPKPAFDFLHINHFFNSYTEYFEDNLGFKKSLSTTNSYFKFKIFNASSKPDRVIIGKDSWLFSVEPSIVGDYQNINSYSENELHIIQKNITEIMTCYRKFNVPFYILALPVKSSIYPEYLPNSVQRKSKPTKLLQLSNFLKQNSTNNFIDMTSDFINEKKNTDLFYQHDIHINYAGGFFVYKKLITELSKIDSRIVPMKKEYYYKKSVRIPNADLSNILSLDYHLLNDEWYLEKGVHQKFTKIDAPTYETIPIKQKNIKSQIKNSQLPKAIVYRDSYFNLIMPYFSENFSECTYIWSYEMSQEVIDKEKPDFVILEMTEATIDRFLNDNPKWIKEGANK